MGAHPHDGTLSQRGRSPIKLAYSPGRPEPTGSVYSQS